MGHFCILVSLRCRAWQISTAVELELPDSETLWIRSLLHTILPWMLNTDEMPSSPWGAPWVPWEEHSNAERFLCYSTILAETRGASQTNPGSIRGVRRSGTGAKFRRKGLPSSAVVYQLWAPSLPVSHPGSAVSVSWAGLNHSGRDEGCLQQDLLLWKPLGL